VNMEKQMVLLRQIQEMEFVAIELQLYLDTHPCDQDAINDYNCAIEKIDKLMEEYTAQYGSLSAQGMHGYEKWLWSDSPWPWEL